MFVLTFCFCDTSSKRLLCGRYCCVRPGDSLARQQASVARWRLEPRLSVLVLAGSLDTAHLELGVPGPGLVVVADSGPGHWPQCWCGWWPRARWRRG